ncbi:hypothetical protein B0O99DRAFT_632733 [Bisporella sp. PMI_857]|nr:hypothetical protein B0O99DRAFT_632733 [Bisporella sp. PMI_857]
MLSSVCNSDYSFEAAGVAEIPAWTLALLPLAIAPSQPSRQCPGGDYDRGGLLLAFLSCVVT